LADKSLRLFKSTIKKDWVEVNTFGMESMPHISALVDAKPPVQRWQDVGYVYVTMSPSTMVENKQNRLILGSSIAAAFLLVSLAIGLFLARGLTKPLMATISALRRIRAGSYDIQLNTTTAGEIGDLQATIVEMAGSLQQFRHDLESKVVARTHELQKATDEAIKAAEEKRKLIQKVNSAIEEERKHIAIELHDQLNASLIVARLESQQILELSSKNPPSPITEKIKEKSQLIINLTSELYTLCRNIVRRLRPEIIDMLGLQGAVEEMINHYNEIQTQCRFEFQALGDFSDLDSEFSITAYRLIQEALSNVMKHADATETHVYLGFTNKQTAVQIKIKDNGKGFDPNTTQPGIGIIGMRERVDGINGQVTLSSTLNEGTTVVIDLPCLKSQLPDPINKSASVSPARPSG
jgi:two-component system sensor histidine kinase UhpB